MNTLLAVDGSENSSEAVRALHYLAEAAQLTLLHAVDATSPAYTIMLPDEAEEHFGQSQRKEGEHLLERVQALLPPHAGPSTKLLRVGPPADVIVSVAEEQNVDLIVMGARGLGPIKEWLLGSVSHHILTLAPCATLIVHGRIKAMQQILLPLQGQFDVEAAIRFLQLKPFHDPVKLTLLTIVPSTEPSGPDGSAAAEMLEKHTDFIEGVATRLRAIGYHAHGVARHGTPSATILQEATTRCSDLILMGTRGRQGMTRLTLGSVSHEVLHKMPCPVLTFRVGTGREKQATPLVNAYTSHSTM